MAAVLAALVVWVPLLMLFVVAPAFWAWSMWQQVQRARRPPRSAYDDAYVRALESIARRNGRRNAERDVADLF